MKKTNALTIHHWQTWVTITINLSHNIPICFNIVCCETREVYTWHTIVYNSSIQVFPKQCRSILILHVTTRYCKHLALITTIHMTCHCCPVSQPFDMVNHYPQILHVPFSMHTPHQIHCTTSEVDWHFENENLVFMLPCKTIVKHKLETLVFLSAMIKSIILIALCTICFDLDTKLW